MKDFIFSNKTKIVFGKESLDKLTDNIKEFSDNILLVYGKGSIKRTGLFNKIVSALNSASISFKELGGIDPNPRIESVVEGAKICRENNIGFILGVGGGSVIDCIKGISIATFYDGDPWDFYSYKTQPEKALPVGSVLTLSATGSEMNSGSVISNMNIEEKNGYGHKLMQPKFSILDPTLTYTVPQLQTAAGVVDIIAHCFEFYFSKVNAAYLQNRMMEAIMKTVIKYGPIAIKEPDNYEARSNIMWASSMALNGVTTNGTTFDGTNHTIEHVVSAIYDITHGVGLGIILPHWLEEVLDSATEEKLVEYARNVWDVNEENNREAALEGIKRTKDFIRSLGLPLKFSEVDIDSSRFQDIADKSMWGETVGIFKPLKPQGVLNILNRAM